MTSTMMIWKMVNKAEHRLGIILLAVISFFIWSSVNIVQPAHVLAAEGTLNLNMDEALDETYLLGGSGISECITLYSVSATDEHFDINYMNIHIGGDVSGFVDTVDSVIIESSTMTYIETVSDEVLATSIVEINMEDTPFLVTNDVQHFCIKLNPKQLGFNTGNGIGSDDFTLAVEIDEAVGLESTDTITIPANGSSEAIAIKPVFISSIEVLPGDAILTAGSDIADLVITTDDWTNREPTSTSIAKLELLELTVNINESLSNGTLNADNLLISVEGGSSSIYASTYDNGVATFDLSTLQASDRLIDKADSETLIIELEVSFPIDDEIDSITVEFDEAQNGNLTYSVETDTTCSTNACVDGGLRLNNNYGDYQIEECEDTYDNDNDGFTDCDDSDCFTYPACNNGSGMGLLTIEEWEFAYVQESTDEVRYRFEYESTQDSIENGTVTFSVPDTLGCLKEIYYNGSFKEVQYSNDNRATWSSFDNSSCEIVTDIRVIESDNFNQCIDCGPTGINIHFENSPTSDGSCLDAVFSADNSAYDSTTSCFSTLGEICDDGINNDGDGYTDCLDIECDGILGCEYGTELTCDDGIDNDGDGEDTSGADCYDTDCDCTNEDLQDLLDLLNSIEDECNDGIDNDNDGFTDTADQDCADDDLQDILDDLSLEDAIQEMLDLLANVNTNEDPQDLLDLLNSIEDECNDGIDNDNNGFTDTADQDCVNEDLQNTFSDILDNLDEEKWSWTSEKAVHIENTTDKSATIKVDQITYDGEAISEYKIYYSNTTLTTIGGIHEVIVSPDMTLENSVFLTLDMLSPEETYYVAVAAVHPTDSSIESLAMISDEVTFTTKSEAVVADRGGSTSKAVKKDTTSTTTTDNTNTDTTTTTDTDTDTNTETTNDETILKDDASVDENSNEEVVEKDTLVLSPKEKELHNYFVTQRNKGEDTNLESIAINIAKHEAKKKSKVIDSMLDDKFFVKMSGIEKGGHKLFFTLLQEKIQSGEFSSTSLVERIQGNLEEHSAASYEEANLNKEVLEKALTYILTHY